MSTIESRLAALEKLYTQQGTELVTCRLEVQELQDLLIVWASARDKESTRAIWDELATLLLPSEPSSAAARQLLDLPVLDVKMEDDPDDDADAPIDWLQATHTVSGKPVYDLVLRPQGDIYGRVGDKSDINALRWFPTTGRCCEAPFSGSDLRKPEPKPTQATATEPKQMEYPKLRWHYANMSEVWSVYLGRMQFGWVDRWKVAHVHPTFDPSDNGQRFDNEDDGRLWLESKFREWFDSLFDEPNTND